MIFSSNEVTRSSSEPVTESPPVSMLNLGDALFTLASFFLFGFSLCGVDVELGGVDRVEGLKREGALAGVCCG